MTKQIVCTCWQNSKKGITKSETENNPVNFKLNWKSFKVFSNFPTAISIELIVD